MDGAERCIDDEIPFDIPDTWKWVRLESAIGLLSGTDFPPVKYNDVGEGIPYITGASNISDKEIIVNRWTASPQVVAENGDILIVCKGSGYGKTIISNIDKAHIARQIMAIRKMNSINMSYILFFLRANIDLLKSRGQGVIPGIDRNSVLSLLLPLPPLEEQNRIVASLIYLQSLLELK